MIPEIILGAEPHFTVNILTKITIIIFLCRFSFLGSHLETGCHLHSEMMKFKI
jgi:hypothetical protein